MMDAKATINSVGWVTGQISSLNILNVLMVEGKVW